MRSPAKARAFLACLLLSVAAPALAVMPAQVGQARTSAKASGFPRITVTDVRTSKPFNLSALAGAGTPVLAWFWSPY